MALERDPQQKLRMILGLSVCAPAIGYSPNVAKDGHLWRATFMSLKINFSDYFDVDPGLLDAYGALNVSLINDLPLFIDPFLLFNSQKEEYQRLHAEIVRYVRYLREIATKEEISEGTLSRLFRFPE